MLNLKCRQWLAAFIFAALVSSSVNAGTHSMFGAKKPNKPDTVLIVHAGTVLTDPADAPLQQQSLIIRNDKLAEVRAGFISPQDIDGGEKTVVEVLDLSGQFVMPGLMDSHVHLSRATGSYQGGFASVNSYPSPAEATVNSMLNAQLSLDAGFTSVRDLGSDPYSVFAVRDSINNGHYTGPNVIASGASVGVSAGHGDDAGSKHPDEKARAGVCDGPDECRTLTRHLEKTGSDLIKIKITGGFSSNSGLRQHMTADEMQAIIDAAHLRGIKVTAHAYESVAIAEAVTAGVDSIEHGYLLDEKTLKLMKKKGVYLIPTLTVAEPPSMVRRFLRGREPVSVTLRNENQAFENAYRMGVKIAFGTDCGIYPHGQNADELAEMVRLGMTPQDALHSATVVAAELFEIEGVTGRLEPGVTADVIAVAGNPLEDISLMKDVSWVIKSGQVVKRDGVMQLPLDYSLPQKY